MLTSRHQASCQATTQVVTFRIRETEDYEEIADLDRAVFIGDDAVTLDGCAWWVVTDDAGATVGYAGAAMHDGGASVYLARCGVLPCARGHGLQRRLVRVREAWGRRQGARVGLTYTRPYNTRSSNNLASCGYRLYRPERKWGSADALYWKRVLHPVTR